MAKFELTIYGENDEVIKRYETNVVRWGVFLSAVKLSEDLKDKKPTEQFKSISDFMKKIFIGISDEDLEKADYNDIFNTFKQILASANSIGSVNSKNV